MNRFTKEFMKAHRLKSRRVAGLVVKAALLRARDAPGEFGGKHAAVALSAAIAPALTDDEWIELVAASSRGGE